MDSARIEQLLERYWRCETSLEEEAQLRAFFNSDDVPSHLRRYQSLFVYLQQQETEGLDEAFDARILAQVETPVVKARRLSLTARFMPLFKAAAAVAVILTLGNVMQRSFFADTREVAAADTVSQQISTPSVALSEDALLHEPPLPDSLNRVKRMEEMEELLEQYPQTE